MPDDKDDKIEVEVEAGGREIEIEIDPKTGEMSVNEEDGDSDASAESREPRPKRRRRRFLAGVILGTLAGAGSAALLGKQSDSPEEPLATSEALQDAPGGASGGLFSSLRTKWREASAEARLASREAEGRKRARFLELTELEDRR